MDSDAFSLLCHEDESCFRDGDDSEDVFVGYLRSGMDFVEEGDDDDEFVGLMINKERSFLGSERSLMISGEKWVERARLDAIKWILKSMDSFSFGLETAYLAVTYMDKFLSKRAIDKRHDWAMPLLAIACLTLAAKVQECKVPPISDFQMEDYAFASDVIQRMELLVLDILDWRLYHVTPFCYLSYFIKSSNESKHLRSSYERSSHLILGIVEVSNCMDHKPSNIAAAAVLALSDEMLSRTTVELKLGLFSPSLIDLEGVLSLYNIMQGVDFRKCVTRKLAYSNSSSNLSNKRRKLGSDDFSHGSCISNEKRDIN